MESVIRHWSNNRLHDIGNGGYELFHEDAGLGHTQEEINQLVEEQKAQKKQPEVESREYKEMGLGLPDKEPTPPRSAGPNEDEGGQFELRPLRWLTSRAERRSPKLASSSSV